MTSFELDLSSENQKHQPGLLNKFPLFHKQNLVIADNVQSKVLAWMGRRKETLRCAGMNAHWKRN